MICKPDGGTFSKTIVETFEEISFAKGDGIIGNYDSCLAKRGATASDWVFLFIKFFNRLYVRAVPIGFLAYTLSAK